jgi:hypothetical protein
MWPGSVDAGRTSWLPVFVLEPGSMVAKRRQSLGRQRHGKWVFPAGLAHAVRKRAVQACSEKRGLDDGWVWVDTVI